MRIRGADEVKGLPGYRLPQDADLRYRSPHIRRCQEASGSGEVFFAAARSAGTDLAEIGDAGA
jgi:hypothetical protein